MDLLELGAQRAREFGLKPCESIYQAVPMSGILPSGYIPMRVYSAQDVDRLLGEGREASGVLDSDDAHTGLVIGIRLCKPASREKQLERVLEEFVRCCEVGDPKLRWGELRERARALLSR